MDKATHDKGWKSRRATLGDATLPRGCKIMDDFTREIAGKWSRLLLGRRSGAVRGERKTRSTIIWRMLAALNRPHELGAHVRARSITGCHRTNKGSFAAGRASIAACPRNESTASGRRTVLGRDARRGQDRLRPIGARSPSPVARWNLPPIARHAFTRQAEPGSIKVAAPCPASPSHKGHRGIKESGIPVVEYRRYPRWLAVVTMAAGRDPRLLGSQSLPDSRPEPASAPESRRRIYHATEHHSRPWSFNKTRSAGIRQRRRAASGRMQALLRQGSATRIVKQWSVSRRFVPNGAEIPIASPQTARFLHGGQNMDPHGRPRY